MITITPQQDEDLEAKLMARVARGDIGAFESLVDRYQGHLIQFFTLLAGDHAVGEELAQEVFLRLYRSRKQYRPKAKFKTYLNQIARNLWIDHSRRRGPGLLSLDWENEVGDPLSARLPSIRDHEPKPEKLALHRALFQLSTDHRMVLLLHSVWGLSQTEISSVLNLPVGTVKSRMHHAIRNLRNLLEAK